MSCNLVGSGLVQIVKLCPSQTLLPMHGQIVESLRLRAMPLSRELQHTKLNVFMDTLFMHLKAKYLSQDQDLGDLRWSSETDSYSETSTCGKKRMS